MQRISDVERRKRLGRRHGLVSPFGTVPEVADALVGLHGSDPATVFLSLRARIDGITIEDIESALYDRAELWRIWAMRRTMFMVPPDLGSVMYAAATRDVVAGERRKLLKMFQANYGTADAEAWLERVTTASVAYLEEVGTATTAEMKDNVDGLDTKLSVRQGNRPDVTMSLASRLLMLLAMDCQVAKGRPAGTWRSSQYEWLSLGAWAGEPLADLPAADAEGRLVSRWLASYGPGTFEDIKWWTGWTVAKTRKALESARAQEVVLEGGVGLVLPTDIELLPDPGPWVALLPGLDPSVMGWKGRDWILGDLADRLFDRNGNAGPTAWVDGEIVGGWAQRPDGSIAVGVLRDPGTEARAALNLEAERLAQWMGPVTLRFRFPSPYEKELRGS
jgi:hypothetical protein